MAAAIAITPLRESNSQTKPIRRTLVSRSSRLKPRPCERLVRTTSPSSTSTFAPAARNRSASIEEIVLFPEPDRPVNQSVNPLCILRRRLAGKDFAQEHVDLALGTPVG